MADSILKLKVESQEYDNKLKRAAEGLQRYADECRKAGDTLTQLDDGVEDFVRELGKMETVSRSAKGSISEMTKAFTDLSVQYNKLTDEEKASPFGKALAQSLETLKGRIQEGNNELKTISGSINDTGGFLNTLKDKFTINIDALKLFNAGVTAAKAALDVAKDAFFASESNVDEWERTVASAESVYQGFLQSLNNGDFSGFIGHINEIIKKAQDACNALDELNTRMTIINPERTRLQARATELKAIIRREGANSEKGQAAQSDLRQLEGMLTQAFKTESQLNMNAFKAQVDKKLQEAGIKLGKRDYDFLMRTFSSDASYMAMSRGAKGSVQMNYEAGGSYDEGSVSKVDTRNINQRLLDIFTDEWRKEYAPLLNAAFSARGGAASTMLSDARYLNGGGSGGGGGRGGAGGSGVDIYALVAGQWDKAMSKGAGVGVKATDMTGPSEAWEAYVASIKNGSQEAADSLQTLIDAFNELNKAEDVTPTGELAQDGKSIDKSFQGAASAISSVASAIGGIEDPTAKIIALIGEAIAHVANAAGQAMSAPDVTSSGYAWIGAAAAITAEMVGIAATIHSATGYEHGGEIKGTTYTGDQIPIMANAGEVVLTRAMAGNLASQLEGGGMNNLHLSATVTAEDIRFVLNNNGRRTGRGEYVTTNFR